MSMTPVALDAITDYLIETLDPEVYDAEAIAEELAELADNAERTAWDKAGRDIRALVARDELTTTAMTLVTARHGLKS
jgi:hypothetical protein